MNREKDWQRFSLGRLVNLYEIIEVMKEKNISRKKSLPQQNGYGIVYINELCQKVIKTVIWGKQFKRCIKRSSGVGEAGRKKRRASVYQNFVLYLDHFHDWTSGDNIKFILSRI